MDRLAHHRHCVVQALSEWLDSPQLELAVKEWEQHYAHQPLFSLSEYARRHLPTLNIEIDANRLRDRVTSCLRDTRAKLNRSNTGTLLRKWRQREGARPDSSAVTRPENDIKPQNLSPSTPEDPATDTTSPPPSAHRVIFCALMANLVSVLNNEAPRAQFPLPQSHRYRAGSTGHHPRTRQSHQRVTRQGSLPGGHGLATDHHANPGTPDLRRNLRSGRTNPWRQVSHPGGTSHRITAGSQRFLTAPSAVKPEPFLPQFLLASLQVRL